MPVDTADRREAHRLMRYDGYIVCIDKIRDSLRLLCFNSNNTSDDTSTGANEDVRRDDRGVTINIIRMSWKCRNLRRWLRIKSNRGICRIKYG